MFVADAVELASGGLGCSFGGEGDFNFCSFEAAFGLLFLVFFVNFLVAVAEAVGLGLSLDPGCCCYGSPVGWCGQGCLGSFENGFFDFTNFSFDTGHVVAHRVEACHDGDDIGEFDSDLVFDDLQCSFGVCKLVSASADRLDDGLEGGLE